MMNVMLVDDHQLFLEGLKYLLETHGVKVLETAKNGKEALAKARTVRPDIILMDIRMPECSGLDVLRLIKAEMPEIRIVMLTTSEEDEDLFNAIKYGASGFLYKDTNATELIDTLNSLENNEVVLSPDLVAKLLIEFNNNDFEQNNQQEIRSEFSNEKKEKLTKRQLKVLEMVAQGITYKEVGETMGLTERTVKYHMARILEILHLENRAQVIAYAAKAGLVEEM